MRLLVPLSRDPASLYAAVSGALRVWEEYRVEEYVLVATEDTPRRTVEYVSYFLGQLVSRITNIIVKPVSRYSAGEHIIGHLREEVIERAAGGDERPVLLVSSAGRSMAAALTVAAVWPRKSTTFPVIHVDFYFGPWRGLHYPYTPRWIQPIRVLHDPGWLEEELVGEQRNAAAVRAFELGYSEAHGCARGGSVRVDLPILRCAIAETARRVNAVSPSGGGTMNISASRRGEDEAYRADGHLGDASIKSLADGVRGMLKRFSDDMKRLRSTIGWAGLSPLRVYSRGGDGLHEFLSSKPHVLLVDTNLVYYGIHAYAWEYGRVEVPQCAEREISRMWAEMIKKGRLDKPEHVAGATAVLGLEDILYVSGGVLPSPPGDCDISMPIMDLQLVEGKLFATADDGAYRYWRRHPVSRIAQPVKVGFNPDEGLPEPGGAGTTVWLSRLHNAVIHAVLLLGILEDNGFLDMFSVSVDHSKIALPLSMLRKGLGLA